MSMDTSFPDVELPFLPPSTIVPWPEDRETFVQYLTRLYEDIALAVNAKEFDFFTFAMSSTYVNIPNMDNFGAYLVCVSGTQSGQPCAVFTLTKPDRDAAGLVTRTQTSPGTGAWLGNEIQVTSTATNFQIAHDRAGVTANFNINIMGTQ